MVNGNFIKKNPLGIAKGIFCLRTFAVLLLFSISLPAISQPKIVITDSKKNFGSVKRGTLVKNSYELENAGDQPLLITDMEVSCSCTSTEYTKQPILPGQKTTLVITFNTASVYGRQDRLVFLKSNAPGADVKLRFKGFVQDKK
ncbi:MAG: DUF1573 domain-containing protein [bacterium]|nr:DUF1573 domain-containing protein [bacterium]